MKFLVLHASPVGWSSNEQKMLLSKYLLEHFALIFLDMLEFFFFPSALGPNMEDFGERLFFNAQYFCCNLIVVHWGKSA